MFSLLLVYGLTYGGALVSLVRPYYGLLIYVAFSCLRPDGLWAWTVPPGNYSRIIAIALIIGWLLHGAGSWRLHRSTAIVGSLAAFMGWAALSAMTAPDQAIALKFLDAMSKIFIPFLIGISLIESPAQLRQLTWAIVLSCGCFALECNLAYYRHHVNVKMDGFAGLGDASVQIMMLVGCVVAFYTGIYAKSRVAGLIALASSGLMVHVILFSLGRGSMLGLLVAGALTIILLPKTPKHMAFLVLAVVLGLRLAGGDVVERFRTSFADDSELDESAKSRFELWADAWDATLKRPFLGIGPDHFPRVAHEYGWPQGKEAHTTWLQLSAELGLPALAFVLAFYGLTVIRLLPFLRNRRNDDPYGAEVAQMVIVTIVAFFVPTQFASLEGLEVPYYVVLIGAGYLKLAGRKGQIPASARFADVPASPYAVLPAHGST